MPVVNKFFPSITIKYDDTDDEEAEVNIIPPTPATIVKVKQEQTQPQSTTCTSSHLELLSAKQQEALVELDVSTPFARSRCGVGSLSNPPPDRQPSLAPPTIDSFRQTMNIGMQSFLVHESEITKSEQALEQLQGRYDKLEAELATQQTAYQQAISEIATLRERLEEKQTPTSPERRSMGTRMSVVHSPPPSTLTGPLKKEEQLRLVDAFQQVSILETHDTSLAAMDLKDAGLQELRNCPLTTSIGLSPFTPASRRTTSTQKSPGLVLDTSSQTDFKFLPALAYFGHDTSIIEPASSTMMQSVLEEDEPRPKRQRKLPLRTARKTGARKTNVTAFTLPELMDSDTENQLAEHLTNLVAAVERDSFMNKKSEEDAQTSATIRRNGHSHTCSSRQPVTTRQLRSKSTIVRRLAPLVETSQFLQVSEDSLALSEDVNCKLAEFANDAEKENVGFPPASAACPKRVLRQRRRK